MKFLIGLILLLTPLANAGPPVIWSSACASGIYNLAKNTCLVTGSGSGTVSSVGLTDSTGLFSITGTPVTTSGSLTLSAFNSQFAKTFLAAPTGSVGAPSFRVIAAGDIPTLNQNTTGTAANITGTAAIANGGTGVTTAQTLPGAQITVVNHANSPYTIVSTDYLLEIDTTGGSVTINLPNPATAARKFKFKDVTGNFGTTQPTIARFGSETIEGTAANLILWANYGNYELQSDLTNWIKTSASSNQAKASFSGNGTWVGPLGVTSITAYGRGGSGGGGGGAGGGGGSTAAGAGGGAGASAGGGVFSIPAAITIVPNTSYAVTIGAGGSAGSGGAGAVANAAGATGSSGGSGGNGGNTSFGSLQSWLGGPGGSPGNPGSLGSGGGSSSTSSLNVGYNSPIPGSSGSGGAANVAGANNSTVPYASPFLPRLSLSLFPGGSAGGTGGGGGGGSGGQPSPGDSGGSTPTASTAGNGGASGAGGGSATVGTAGTLGYGGCGGSGGGGGGLLASTGSAGGNGAAGTAGNSGILILTWSE